MKRWHAILPNWAIITLLALIVSLNLISSYYALSFLTKAVTLATIPLLLTFYFAKQRIMANVFFVIFFLYFFGLFFNVFENFHLSSKFSESYFLGAYALLVFVMIGKLKHMKFEVLVTCYLIVVFLVNSYLMYLMFVAIKDSFEDNVIFTLSVSRGIALLVMAFLAFAIYLSRETSQSILFLTVVCCFVFSDVLSFISTMYIHFWLFEGIQKILQSLGLILSIMYVFNYQEITTCLVRSRILKRNSQSNQVPVHY